MGITAAYNMPYYKEDGKSRDTTSEHILALVVAVLLVITHIAYTLVITKQRDEAHLHEKNNQARLSNIEVLNKELLDLSTIVNPPEIITQLIKSKQDSISFLTEEVNATLPGIKKASESSLTHPLFFIIFFSFYIPWALTHQIDRYKKLQSRKRLEKISFLEKFPFYPYWRAGDLIKVKYEHLPLISMEKEKVHCGRENTSPESFKAFEVTENTTFDQTRKHLVLQDLEARDHYIQTIKEFTKL